jgi:SAM-dependent methyltransferase
MSALSGEVPQDWYRRAFDGDTAEVPWTEGTVSEVDRVLRILPTEGGERILDLACGSGRHSLELAQRGFSVVGVDISAELIEIANSESKDQGLDVAFLRADIRELAFDPLFDAEFDIVLNLNDGAVGYLESGRILVWGRNSSPTMLGARSNSSACGPLETMIR